MNTTILALTLRQLLSRRRALLMLGLAVLPVIIAVAVRFGNPEESDAHWVANVLLKGLVVTTLLPLVTLVFGTGSIGMEIEDGTAVYLLSKPLRRIDVIVPKLAAAWLPAALLVLFSTSASGAIALQEGDGSILIAFAAASLFGALAYTAVFLLLSLITSRALIAGLVYVFLWEGVVTELFTGTRVFSIRQYTLGVADLIADTSPRVFTANLDGGVALLLMAVVTAAAVGLAARRLSRFEIRGGD